ncbi:hypothetical protein [Streptomyces sp. NPDC054854]
MRTADEVEVFEAYHSVLSTEPGVMFVSGFSCDPAEYTAVFTSPRYQEIVRQAGDRFIAVGERGLYTRSTPACRSTPYHLPATGRTQEEDHTKERRSGWDRRAPTS